MLKVCSDFNAITTDGVCFVLYYRDMALDRQIADLVLSKGDKITLYQDNDDFEVVAALDFRFVDALKQEAWIATPGWSTLVRK